MRVGFMGYEFRKGVKFGEFRCGVGILFGYFLMRDILGSHFKFLVHKIEKNVVFSKISNI